LGVLEKKRFSKDIPKGVLGNGLGSSSVGIRALRVRKSLRKYSRTHPFNLPPAHLPTAVSEEGAPCWRQTDSTYLYSWKEMMV
jgi:hypothetical protein